MNRLRFASIILIVAAMSVVMVGCQKTTHPFDVVAQYEKEVAAIDQYLADNGIAHIKDPSGVRIAITKLGYGMPALSVDDVEVKYKGMLFSNGNVFEESTTSGPLTQYIRGWQYALLTLPVGSEATLYIPSYHAYGQNAVNTIPRNSTLVFDITFKKATHTALFKQRFTSDTTAINTYVSQKAIDVVKDTTGIRYMHTQQGTGDMPTWYDPVKVNFSIKLLSDDTHVAGTFSREPADNFSSRVVDFIPGIQVALQKMKVGGKLRVFIPSGLAFGINPGYDDNKTVVVPPNSNLIVDIELLDIVN